MTHGRPATHTIVPQPGSCSAASSHNHAGGDKPTPRPPACHLAADSQQLSGSRLGFGSCSMPPGMQRPLLHAWPSTQCFRGAGHSTANSAAGKAGHGSGSSGGGALGVTAATHHVHSADTMQPNTSSSNGLQRPQVVWADRAASMPEARALDSAFGADVATLDLRQRFGAASQAITISGAGTRRGSLSAAGSPVLPGAGSCPASSSPPQRNPTVDSPFAAVKLAPRPPPMHGGDQSLRSASLPPLMRPPLLRPPLSSQASAEVTNRERTVHSAVVSLVQQPAGFCLLCNAA